MRLLRSSLLMTAALAGLFGRPGLAQECTPGGWCLLEGDSGRKKMYKVTGRSGQFVYTKEQYTSKPYSTEWGPVYQLTYDCKNWEISGENEPWYPIVPGTVGDETAKDVCKR